MVERRKWRNDATPGKGAKAMIIACCNRWQKCRWAIDRVFENRIRPTLDWDCVLAKSRFR